jgi:hypothetical protein
METSKQDHRPEKHHNPKTSSAAARPLALPRVWAKTGTLKKAPKSYQKRTSFVPVFAPITLENHAKRPQNVGTFPMNQCLCRAKCQAKRLRITRKWFCTNAIRLSYQSNIGYFTDK